MTLEIGTMARADLATAIDWAAREGWNPGLHDAAAFHSADPFGWLAARVDGQIAATISVVRYPGDFGFLGFYIADPAFRGRGIGYRLWQAGIDYLAGAVIGLDGVLAQQANYAKSGFALAYRNIRFEGAAPAVAAPPTVAIIDADRVPFDRLCAYDRRHFPAPRAAFLTNWIAQPGTRARVIIQDGQIAGFGVRRACRDGHKIAPLFADSAALGEALLVDLCAGLDGQKIILDVPEPNGAALALAARQGLVARFETARMYKGQAPDMSLDTIFGITSFELG